MQSNSAQSNQLRLQSALRPSGDQPAAIASLLRGFEQNQARQTLLGVTGSGKTFTVANVAAKLGLPTLVIAHNKTLAAQLYEEFRAFFPENAVEYFVSYYDYYQPEAYVPSTDTYIDKDATINDAIDRLRHSATRALFERQDVIIVASVSCIYGLGSAEAYYGTLLFLQSGQDYNRDRVLRHLISVQYTRGDYDFKRGSFRVRGDCVEVFPAHQAELAVRITFFGDTIEQISLIDPLRGQTIEQLPKIAIYPCTHHVVTQEAKDRAVKTIQQELRGRLQELRRGSHLLEAQRLEQRTHFDLEMLVQMGNCRGVENYSRHLTGRTEGQPPPTLLDYFPQDFLVVIDESHQTLPQLRAMYRGDRARKQTLVDHGFRLPSALDNRPLTYEEFDARLAKVLYVSATPGELELEQCQGVVVEQLIRPTGLVDPPVTVRGTSGQMQDLLAEIKAAIAAGERVLVTTLTKRMAEDLSDYLSEQGIAGQYLHADIDTLERIKLIAGLRAGDFDVLVGINLLREGLDIPEVALVAILDADKEGFLRSTTALVQIMGRAARHVRGRVILYADAITPAMHSAIAETERRRSKQLAYNQTHHIIPKSTQRSHADTLQNAQRPPEEASAATRTTPRQGSGKKARSAQPAADGAAHIAALRAQMAAAIAKLDFEQAASLRDALLALGVDLQAPKGKS